jgi:chemotaxis protein methyltransferase CheR
MTAGFSILQRFVREASGLALDDDKRYLIEDRLQPVLRDAKLHTIDDLANQLHGNQRSDLARAVTEALTINETSFFRDKLLFTTFAETVLPALIAARKDQRRLRIWCAGCSSGQEPYSLAMIIDEQMRQLSGWQIEIVATDLSRSIIEAARRGRYSQFEVQRGLPVTLLLRYFQRVGESWQISDYLRAKVAFSTLNLMQGFKDIGRFDIVFCRNVLIYFDAETKARVLTRLTDAMADDGYLALGGAERIGGLCAGLKPDGERQFLYVKDPSARGASGIAARRISA